MAHLKTVEKWLTYDFLPSGVPLQVDGVVPPLAARTQQTGWALLPRPVRDEVARVFDGAR